MSENKGSISYLVGVCLVAALGGLLFGYDTGVINGSLKYVQIKFELSAAMKGFAASSALLACIFGAAFAGSLSDRLGRKRVLILSAILFLISAIGTAMPHTLTQFIIFRFIGGLGVGAASMTSPMYIAEIAPSRIRGRLVSVNQFAIIFGMLVVYFVNFFIGSHGSNLNQAEADKFVQGHIESKQLVLSDDARKMITVQVKSQIDNYWQQTDPKLVKSLADALDQRLNELSVPDQQRLDIARGQLDIEGEKWDAEAFCGAVSARLARYGLQVKEQQVQTQAEQIANQVKGSAIDVDIIAQEVMYGSLFGKISPAPAVSQDDKNAAQDLVKAMVPEVSGLGANAWSVKQGWRWMFGSESIPAILLFLLLFMVPESPRWLTKQGRGSEALAILSKVDGDAYAGTEMQSIESTLNKESGSLSQLFKPGMRIVLAIGVVLAVLQQVTGINVFLYFGSEIFETLGKEKIDAALLQQVVVGAVNLVFTVIAIWTVDKLGRKPLMLIGSAGMGISLFAMGMAGWFQMKGAWLLIFVLGYIACFALSVGPVVWVILSEIFPTKIRGRAMGIATVCLWLANTVVSQTFPMMDQNPYLIKTFHHGFPFFIYGSMCVVLILFVWKYVPETKGKTLEEIETMWQN